MLWLKAWQRLRKIGEIIVLINNIASQSNLPGVHQLTIASAPASLSQLSNESRLARSDFPVGFSASQRSATKMPLCPPRSWQTVYFCGA